MGKIIHPKGYALKKWGMQNQQQSFQIKNEAYIINKIHITNTGYASYQNGLEMCRSFVNSGTDSEDEVLLSNSSSLKNLNFTEKSSENCGLISCSATTEKNINSITDSNKNASLISTLADTFFWIGSAFLCGVLLFTNKVSVKI